MSEIATDPILDATRAAVLDFGIRRTTLTDVARRAGMSRMTVYRRYPDVDAILRELMTHEFGALMRRVGQNVDAADGRGRVVERMLASIDGLREHPLLVKILEAEPELLLPYVLGELGGTQRQALDLIARDIAAGQEEGSIRRTDPHLLAHLFLLLAQAVVFRGAKGELPPHEELMIEMRAVLDAALRP